MEIDEINEIRKKVIARWKRADNFMLNSDDFNGNWLKNTNMIEDVTMEVLEKRMYFFTIYQLTGIQKGIQCGHCVEEYISKYGSDPEYQDYFKNWKTWYVYNGGTTNDDEESKFYGSINDIVDQLEVNDIKYAVFREPDLNNSITAVCFLCDERVWNYEKYPDFTLSQPFDGGLITFTDGVITNAGCCSSTFYYNLNTDKNPDGQTREAWIEYMGGEKNLFLRELIKGRRFA